MRDARELGAVFVGGAVGAVARAGLGESVPVHPGSWPWATFVANIAACLLLGYVAVTLLDRRPPATLAFRLLGTGLCGGLSTFSTLQVELVRLAEADAWGVAVGYAAASLVCGLLAVQLTSSLARR